MKRITRKYLRHLIIAFVLMAISWVMVFLMVLKILPVTYFFNFVAYGLATIGLFLGCWGIFNIMNYRDDD